MEKNMKSTMVRANFVGSRVMSGRRRPKRILGWKKMFSEAVWHAPARRDQVKSLDTGPAQEYTFNVDPTRSATDLLFDALPVRFFASVVKQSRECICQETSNDVLVQVRATWTSWFDTANYIRVFAAVLMRGLGNARDDPSFFSGLLEGRKLHSD